MTLKFSSNLIFHHILTSQFNILKSFDDSLRAIKKKEEN